MTQFTYSDELFSDLYKEVYGTRPKGFLFTDYGRGIVKQLCKITLGENQYA